MQRLLFIGTLVLFTMGSFAQQAAMYSNEQPWSASPVLHALPENYRSHSAVYLMDSRTFHYRFEAKTLFQYNYVYRLIKVMDDKGIEMFNKIYLPLSRSAKLMDVKARVITSGGKVIDVPSDKMKEEEEDGRLYKFFAMEGLDKGAEIEYTYTLKTDPSFFGSEIFHSKTVPYYKTKLLIITPSHLVFAAKGFNGFTMLPDSVINEERLMPGYSENIKELDDEKYGVREPYLQRVDFKFSYNLAQNKEVELYTWKELARRIYTNVSTFNEKERKAMDKFIAAANMPADAGEEQTIRLLEDYMKVNINVDEKLVSEDANNIEAIIKSGNTNHFGAVRFYVAMLENRQIKYQVVFPSVRNQVPLDETLANWNRVDETLIYFPGTGKFVEPVATALRYPYVDAYWAGTRGLFLKGTTIGDVKTAVGRFDDIPIEPFEQNATNMEVHARLDASGDSLIINSKQILKGYSATYYRPLWVYLPKDKQEEAVKDIIRGIAKSEHIENITTTNTKLTDAWDNKPLLISGTIHTAELLERAGNKLLFKIGELIGSQEQMYQEKPRQLPAEVQYPHILERKISFDIPAGYTIKNMEDINIDVQHKNGAEVTMGFVSSYKVTGNKLEVYVLETYRDLKYPLSDFATFKNVINAAADFNKIVLVLEKKV